MSTLQHIVPLPFKELAIVLQIITSHGRVHFVINTTTNACDQLLMIPYELAAAIDMSSYLTGLHTNVELLAKSSVLV